MTASYELSPDAQQDLREVARYTGNRWGREALEKYRNGLHATFDSIGDGSVFKRTFSKEFPHLLVTKYRYHFVFYIREGLERPVIIGVVHERRDTVNRLIERLS